MSSDMTLALRYAERIVSVRAPKADLVWLAEFLAPWFETASTARCEAQVHLIRDDQRVQALEASRSAAATGPVEAFAMDGGMQTLPEWRGAGKAPDIGELSTEDFEAPRVAFDEALAAYYLVRGSHAKTQIEIVTRTDARKARIALMKAVRELAMSETIAAGHPLLHGAALAFGDRGILIAGPKRAGKTTLLVHGLLAGGQLVSNDRVVLRNETDGTALALGMPTVLSVRPMTLAALPELEARLELGRFDHLHSLAEIESGRAPLRPRPGKPRNLSSAQLCEVTGASARKSVALNTLLLLTTGDSPGVAIRELGFEDAARRLAESRFGTPSIRASELFAPPRRARAARSSENDAALGADHPPAVDLTGLTGLTRRARCLAVELGIGTPAAEIDAAVKSIFKAA